MEENLEGGRGPPRAVAPLEEEEEEEEEVYSRTLFLCFVLSFPLETERLLVYLKTLYQLHPLLA